MQRLHRQATGISATNRSQVTNGTRLLMGVDGRSPTARRFRDLVHAFEAEFEATTELDRGLIRQAALLTLKSEQLQAAVVNGEAVNTEILTNLSGQIRRLLGERIELPTFGLQNLRQTWARHRAFALCRSQIPGSSPGADDCVDDD